MNPRKRSRSKAGYVGVGRQRKSCGEERRERWLRYSRYWSFRHIVFICICPRVGNSVFVAGTGPIDIISLSCMPVCRGGYKQHSRYWLCEHFFVYTRVEGLYGI